GRIVSTMITLAGPSDVVSGAPHPADSRSESRSAVLSLMCCPSAHAGVALTAHSFRPSGPPRTALHRLEHPESLETTPPVRRPPGRRANVPLGVRPAKSAWRRSFDRTTAGRPTSALHLVSADLCR